MSDYVFPNMPVKLNTGDRIIFYYTGGAQVFLYNKYIKKIKIECYGASGSQQGYGSACYGGYVYGTMDYASYGKTLYVYCGQNGNGCWYETFGGGGCSNCNGTEGSGGGGTDVRTNPSDYYSRFIVAGGGGGADRIGGKQGRGGVGGGWVGGNGAYTDGGATQSSGGINNRGSGTEPGYFFRGGNGTDYDTGGGGGWYGGASGSGSGGGSSYVSGNPNCNGTQTNSGIKLTDSGTIAGVNGGAGYVIFTVLELNYNRCDSYSLNIRTETSKTVSIPLFLYDDMAMDLLESGDYILRVRGQNNEQLFAFLTDKQLQNTLTVKTPNGTMLYCDYTV